MSGAGFEDAREGEREARSMTTNVIALSRQDDDLSDEELRYAAADLAAARYVDREMSDARATAELCGLAATRARSARRHLLAGVLAQIEVQLVEDAALLVPASLPGARWPRRDPYEIDQEANAEELLEALDDALRHSARTLRWIASRPDLPPLARVTFAAIATARDARRHLILASRSIDD
jgi:hypothetical protein